MISMISLTPLGFRPLLAQNGIWLDVPFVRQEKNRCGAACISMVMQYWAKVRENGVAKGIPDTTQMGQALYSKEAEGIFGRDMERYFRDRGYDTFVFKAGWADLEHHLSKGRPLIVCLKGNGKGPHHYVIVTGLDQQDGLVLVNDPSQRKLRKRDRANFERSWNFTGNWTLLAVPQLSPTSQSILSDAK